MPAHLLQCKRIVAGGLLFSLFALAILWFSPAQETAKNEHTLKSPLTPAQERKSFRTVPGLRLELVACEPQVQSPVAMTFDENGKLWVVEMRDYPNGPKPGEAPEGRIVVLQDRNGDGFYEQSQVFADKLLFANGVLRWRDGVIVTQAPNIIWLRDTNGDGKADKREVLYEGFAAKNPQLRVSHPNLGIDNWVYVANGLRGGQVRRAGDAKAKPISLSGMDFRFNLLDGRHEAISGLGQYGNTFDDWGRRFVCDNRHHLRHIVLPNRYLKRNPYLAVPAVVNDISVLESGPLYSGGKLYPLSKNWTTSNLHAGRFTAACGVYIYRSGLLPKEFYGNAFTCDPTADLVHREIVEPHGASFQSHPARKGVEFLATPDDWARPVFLTDGPDGALYVVDMYRAVIEHPQFMPPELKNRPDLVLGKDKGRIWRIVPEKHKTTALRPALSKASTQKLVSLLSHPHGWYRITAQRLLLQRQDKTALKPLRKLCTSGKDPRGRLHAAWLLHTFGALDEKLLLRLLDDAHPRLREHAVRLSEDRGGWKPPLRKKVLALANDPDARVRYQVALSLGEWKDGRIVAPLASIGLAGVEDQWTRYAVLSSIPEHPDKLLTAVLQSQPGLTKKSTPARQEFLQELTNLIGARRDKKEITRSLDALLHLQGNDVLSWQMIGLEGLAEGMNRRGSQLGVFLKSLPKAQATIAACTTALLEKSAAIARDKKQPMSQRLTAIRLLAQVSWEKASPALISLMKKDQPTPIRLAAVRSLASHNRPEVADILLKSWRGYTPAMRGTVTSALLQRTDRIDALFKEVKAGRVKPGDIDAVSTRRLLNYRQVKIRQQANKLLRGNLPEARLKALARYQAALKMKGEAARGKKVFEKNCATCHRIGSLGVDVGPVISDTRTKTASALLNDILNPNQAIDNNYVNYLVVTKSGKVLNGLIVTETASSITLRRANNETDVVLRQDIDEITSSGTSLMPEGLEKNIGVQDMADLLSFLKNWRYLDGSVPAGVQSGG